MYICLIYVPKCSNWTWIILCRSFSVFHPYPSPRPSSANTFAPAPERPPLSPKKKTENLPTLDPAAASLAAAPAPAANAFLGTPQSANPMAMLKNNLKSRVRRQLEEKIARMPTSPYALMEGETETGSPEYAFSKVVVKPAAGRGRKSGAAGHLPPAAKYLTAATPLAVEEKR